MIEAGQLAPDFALENQAGETVRLADFRGRKIILYFYPKDDTPGCTKQACELRDHAPEIAARGAVVLGVSPDSPASHRKFREKYHLDFTLLADTTHAVAEQYGVWKEKSRYGRKYWGIERTTILIDDAGRIMQVLPRVKPATHVGQVLEVI